MTEPRRIVVLISGSGTNFQALIDASSSSTLSLQRPPKTTQIVLVLSNRKNAYGLTRAAQSTPPIPTAYLALQPYLKSNPGKTREDYDAQVAKIVLKSRPDLVVLAGWMHVLSERFLSLLDGTTSSSGTEGEGSGWTVPEKGIPVINLHPALPGAFDGANAIDRAYDAFTRGEIKETGVMVHRVIKEVDRGEPVLTERIPFREGESLEEFEKRLHEVEWKVIVKATAMVVDSLDEE